MVTNKIKIHEIIAAAADIGAAMLEYGGEVYRVESSIRFILTAYGCNPSTTDIFAIPSSIIITVNDEDGRPITKTKRIFTKEIDLNKVDKLNNLSRHICKRKPSYNSIMHHFNKIIVLKPYPFAAELVCYAIVGFAFTIFFGGTLPDAVAGSFVALSIKVLRWILDKLEANEFFMCFFCSGYAALIAILAVNLGVADQSDKIIIGSLMTLVPGIAITNCMRDLIVGDFMAGLARMADAILTAVGIAAGTIVVLTVFRMFE